VDLVEVDRLRLETAEARFALPPEGIRLQALRDFALLVPNQLALGEGVRTLRAARERPADDFFRVAKS
jgi:hypothetical protein